MARRVRLIHWNKAEAAERAGRLTAWGYTVEAGAVTPADLRQLREAPPEAVVIDLSRLPSQGRDVGLALRTFAATRRVPLVFVEGDPDKVARVKALLPDAAYTTWGRIRSALKEAIARPPAAPVVPQSALAGYAGTALPKKLGIKAGSVVAFVNAPATFGDTLGNLPHGVIVTDRLREDCRVAVWFVQSLEELRRGIAPMAALLTTGSLWIAWPKKSSSLAADLTQQRVRDRPGGGTGRLQGLRNRCHLVRPALHASQEGMSWVPGPSAARRPWAVARRPRASLHVAPMLL